MLPPSNDPVGPGGKAEPFLYTATSIASLSRAHHPPPPSAVSRATQGLRRYASENTELTSKIALKALFDLDEEAQKRATGQRRF